MKKTYFLADAHFGSRAIADEQGRERRLARFLYSIKDQAKAIWMLGDMFDFWHEYRLTVPRGFTRFLGMLSYLTDHGVQIHYLTGNHDLWMHDYLEHECGVILHKQKLVPALIDGHHFLLAHGDGLDKKDKHYLALRAMFHNGVCQRLFAAIHPRWALSMGYAWAAHSRLKHEGQEGIAIPEAQDGTLAFARAYATAHPDTDYFIIGHRHIDQQSALPNGGRFIVLGDWISKFSYAEFDGETLTVSHYKDGAPNSTNN